MSVRIDRRSVVTAIGVIAAGLATGGWTKSRRLAFGSPVGAMKPGDYTWAPERSETGSLVVIVSIPEQRGYVYRDGVLIAVTTCSTGRKGHRTPTGVFSVLQKDKDHVSSTYKGAKMPFMERLTWSGIALHAGNLPGYPASHGCIRLPYEFAGLLFGISHLGVVAIIADAHSEPSEVVHPSLFLPQRAQAKATALVAELAARKHPPLRRHESGHRPAKVIISVADRKLTILEDGHVRIAGPLFVKDSDVPVGNHVFVLKHANPNETALRWIATGYSGAANGRLTHRPDASILERLTTDDVTAQALHKFMHPGLVMVVTDASAHAGTRSPRGFVIATHHEPEGWVTEVRRN